MCLGKKEHESKLTKPAVRKFFFYTTFIFYKFCFPCNYSPFLFAISHGLLNLFILYNVCIKKKLVIHFLK